jgi:hypothetical protein
MQAAAATTELKQHLTETVVDATIIVVYIIIMY